MTLSGFWREEEETIDMNNLSSPCEGLQMLPTRHDKPTASTSVKPLALGPQGAGEGGA